MTFVRFTARLRAALSLQAFLAALAREPIEAEIPASVYRALNLREGETLVVRPRRVRVFLDQPASASA